MFFYNYGCIYVSLTSPTSLPGETNFDFQKFPYSLYLSILKSPKVTYIFRMMYLCVRCQKVAPSSTRIRDALDTASVNEGLAVGRRSGFA